MVSAWFMDDSKEDPRAEHHRDPPQFIELEGLKQLTGVLYWKLDTEHPEADPLLEEIRQDRGYSYKDEITCSRDTLGSCYEDKLRTFFTEHLHSDEEIRLVLDGSGYFDVRDLQDRWIRVKVVKGDLIVLPAGIYHRFTLDQNDYIRAMRLFVGEPVWTPINRPADDHPARLQFVKTLAA